MDDSWYLGLACSFWFRSKALTGLEIFHSKFFFFAWKYSSKKRKIGFQLGSTYLVLLSSKSIKLRFLAVPAWNVSAVPANLPAPCGSKTRTIIVVVHFTGVTIMATCISRNDTQSHWFKKNPAYGRQRIFRPMRIVGLIQL